MRFLWISLRRYLTTLLIRFNYRILSLLLFEIVIFFLISNMIDQIFVFVRKFFKKSFFIFFLVNCYRRQLCGIQNFQKPASLMFGKLAIIYILKYPFLHSNKPVQLLSDATYKFGLVFVHFFFLFFKASFDISNLLISSPLIIVLKDSDCP